MYFWPVISFNSLIWVIIMDIVISCKPHPASGSGQMEKGRGGEDGWREGGSAWRIDVKIWRGVITVTFFYLPLSTSFNLSPWWLAARISGPLITSHGHLPFHFAAGTSNLSRKILCTQLTFEVEWTNNVRLDRLIFFLPFSLNGNVTKRKHQSVSS